MTIKDLADELGVEKYKIKYLCSLLPPNYTVKVDNRILLSAAAVDAIRRKLSGGELVSDIPVTPYCAYNPEGWIITDNFEEKAEKIGENSSNFTDESEIDRRETGESDFDRTNSEEAENRTKSENIGETALTFIDLCKSALAANNRQMQALQDQLSAKDEQIRALQEQLTAQTATFTQASEAAEQRLSDRDAQIAALTESVMNHDRDSDAATLAQLQAKDSQIERLQGTIDALTRQLEATLSREEPRRWWQLWKR